MTSSTKKRVLLFQGPGFLEDGVIEEAILSLGYELHVYNVLPAQTQSTELDLSVNDTMILRGLSSGSIEDFLYTKIISRGLSSLGKQISRLEPASRPRIFASGRWALGASLAGFWGSENASLNYQWKAVEGEGLGVSWLAAKASSGESFSVLKSSDMILEFQAPEIQTLITSAVGQALGWKLGSRNYLFSVEPFSLVDGSQLPDFGYENQEDLVTGLKFFENLLGAAHGED